MQKKIFHLIAAVLLCVTAHAKQPLNDPILKAFDGVKGMFDKSKVEKTLWMIKEIKAVHAGSIKIDSSGKPDPIHGTPTDLIFQGKKQTIHSLKALEKNLASLSPQEKKELNALFKLSKDYLGNVNSILLADARGAHQIIVKLINEYCRKNNRSSSLLLKWDDKGGETESYNHDIVNFNVLYIFSTDLMNFLAALILSCPKAKTDYANAHHKKA